MSMLGQRLQKAAHSEEMDEICEAFGLEYKPNPQFDPDIAEGGDLLGYGADSDGKNVCAILFDKAAYLGAGKTVGDFVKGAELRARIDTHQKSKHSVDQRTAASLIEIQENLDQSFN